MGQGQTTPISGSAAVTDPLFGWMSQPSARRSGLRSTLRAVRAGWLDGAGQAGRRRALVDALVRLLSDPTMRPRELARVDEIVSLLAQGRPA